MGAVNWGSLPTVRGDSNLHASSWESTSFMACPTPVNGYQFTNNGEQIIDEANGDRECRHILRLDYPDNEK